MILAHPNLEESIGNKTISEIFAKEENTEVRNIHQLYPDFQIDINNDDFKDRISYDSAVTEATTDNLGIDGFDYSDKNSAREALEVLEGAQRQVNGYRANLGAIQNRLISTSENLSVAVENFSAANSRIRDTDIAESSAGLATAQILHNASVGVLAQANQQPSAALRLIG